MDLADVSVRMLAAGFLTFIARGAGWTQPTAGPPPAVGIVEAIRRWHARRKLNRDFYGADALRHVSAPARAREGTTGPGANHMTRVSRTAGIIRANCSGFRRMPTLPFPATVVRT